MDTDDPRVVLRALMLASDANTSAQEGCGCEHCKEARDQMLEWFLNEAREQMEREVGGQDFSGRLRDTMKAKRMSVIALSRLTEIPERTINRYRAGVSEPRDAHGEPTPNAHAIAAALSVDVNWLFASARFAGSPRSNTTRTKVLP